MTMLFLSFPPASQLCSILRTYSTALGTQWVSSSFLVNDWINCRSQVQLLTWACVPSSSCWYPSLGKLHPSAHPSSSGTLLDSRGEITCVPSARYDASLNFIVISLLVCLSSVASAPCLVVHCGLPSANPVGVGRHLWSKMLYLGLSPSGSGGEWYSRVLELGQNENSDGPLGKSEAGCFRTIYKQRFP